MYYASFDKNGVGTSFYSESAYPLNPDGSANALLPPNVIALSLTEWNALMQGRVKILNGVAVACNPPLPTASPSDVDAERDRRMYGGFVFNGVVYQTDTASITNILGSAQLAFMAIVAGAKQGDYQWTGAGTPFVYIAADNSRNQMDAQTVVAFAKAAAIFRSQIIYAARAAKDALLAGQSVDVYADSTWGVDSTSPTSTAVKSAPTGPSGPSGPTGTSNGSAAASNGPAGSTG